MALSIICACGGPKAKQAKQCITCYKTHRKLSSKTSRDHNICRCGSYKYYEARQCRLCFNKRPSVCVRGPYPEDGQAAIYLLRDEKIEKVFYVGSTVSPKRRVDGHRRMYGLDTVMLIIKLVDIVDRWPEELKATVEYERFISRRSGMTPPPYAVGRDEEWQE